MTAESNGEGRLSLEYSRMGGQRPWGEILTIRQHGGYLRPGEQIAIRLGDRRRGSPGLLTQTFAEAGRDFRVMADVQATGNFYPLPDLQLTIPVIAGPAAAWKAVTATLRRPREPFILGIKAEDFWGNPTAPAPCRVAIHANIPIDGLPEFVDFDGTRQAITLENLSCDTPGTVTFTLTINGQAIATAGPVTIRDGGHAGYWGDLHGQSGETVGIGRIEDYMNFARNRAFLDVVCHQGNDFQIKDNFWKLLNEVTAEWNEPGRFTTFPGYEWSGSTAVGGDRNVIFAEEGCTIRRCSHALLEDQSGSETDAHTITQLYKALRESGDNTVIFAHVGGRYADIHIDHDPELETAVEIHSDWGTFEWIAQDSFRLGRRIGIVANSDGHKGRPGASYPGISEFGAYGGLTCFLAADNSRAALLDAIRSRHHYATTGCRLALDVASNSGANISMMGDIVMTGDETIPPILALDRLPELKVLKSGMVRRWWKPCAATGPNSLAADPHHLVGCGISRARTKHAVACVIDVDGSTIMSATPINRWNPERLFEQRGSSQLAFESVTTGNFAGVDLQLSSIDATISLRTNLGDIDVRSADLLVEPQMLDCGGLDRRLTISRLPDDALPNTMVFEREVALRPQGDSPVWVCVTTEDGHKAWSSPIYFVR